MASMILPRPIWVRGAGYEGARHWHHPALLVRDEGGLLVVTAPSGTEVATRSEAPFVSLFDTTGHYWTDRWYNVIRLDEPGGRLQGFYCNIATPARLEGDDLHYADLQLDVRVTAIDGALHYEVWDEDEFEEARQRHAYSEDLVRSCRDAVDQLIAFIESRTFPFDH
jgi:protein associated with RNAse G/E